MPSKRNAQRNVPDRMNILLVGGGAREHAIAWRLRKSKRVVNLWTTHPNAPGLASLARPIDCKFDPASTRYLERFCKDNTIDLAIIGPEEPLALGLADRLEDNAGCAVFGPRADAARLESDKAWAKQLMRAASIPTADARSFTNPEAAIAYLETRETPHVIKASGLAKGKGVILPDSLEQALDAINRIMVEREFGDAGKEVVIEERLKGNEVSVLALVDGRTIWILEPCHDHKRLGEHDTGPNTGGMGAFCPAKAITGETMDRIQSTVLVPAIDALRREGATFKGLLYAGLMLTPAGPKVLEFNVRFGDPECQTLMIRFKGDLADVLYRTATGTLADASFDWDPRPSCCIVLASAGYPVAPRTGDIITGIAEAESMKDIHVFHAGTARNDAGKLVTAGGRVLSVTALGETLEDARNRALEACDAIHFDGKQLRRDIGAPAPARTPS